MLETCLIIILIAGLCLLSFRRKSFTPPKTMPADKRIFACFERVDNLFVNQPEREFFDILNRNLPSDYHLHSKVRLEDIVRVKRQIEGRAQWHLRGRVKSRHVDYLITNKFGVPKAAIELDGSSHNKETLNADNFKDDLFNAVGLPLIRVASRSNYTAVSRKILAQLESQF
ncbi:DUF2726 domain-containing protein [Hellea balneolensis]|uniref:DUF2726 domain-containing protein n=1 Tax=Hellea balneolensis TaxID=287478 RepID=UPI00047971AC|nr:DUF2726 domain-containing protein [Hellea balneolensis]